MELDEDENGNEQNSVESHNHKVDPVLAEEVGKASYEALTKAKSMIRPGVKLLDVASAAEDFLKEKGFGCAFPLNLSVNEQAAHYTPSVDDPAVFPENGVVKVDFGASKNGVLGDCAVTVDLSGNYGKLVEAAEAALTEGINRVKAGVKVSAIGADIAKAIESRGYLPVKNLGGHEVAVHDLHSRVFIPNYDNGDNTVIEEGMVIAIEPFAVDGRKQVVFEADLCDIYSYNGAAQVRDSNARRILEEIDKTYPTEPFAVRWLSDIVPSRFNLYLAVKEMLRADMLHPYPTLIGYGTIAQAEAEVLVTEDGCKVLTKP